MDILVTVLVTAQQTEVQEERKEYRIGHTRGFCHLSTCIRKRLFLQFAAVCFRLLQADARRSPQIAPLAEGFVGAALLYRVAALTTASTTVAQLIFQTSGAQRRLGH